MDLTTSYLGLPLRSPLVPSASPLSEQLDNIKRMEDAGAGAVVLYSIFEEQVHADRARPKISANPVATGDPHEPDLLGDPTELFVGIDDYLQHIQRAKAATSIPIIASLNGSTPGGWTSFATQIEEAGADALELNLYSLPTDPQLPGSEVERQYLEIVRAVKSGIRLPIAVKLSPYFSNFGYMAHQFDAAGANALVLFNRFYQPDIDLESLEVVPSVVYSTPAATRLPMRWIAILYERIKADLAATSGIHRGTDAIKMIMSGASVAMLCSSLLRHGIKHLGTIGQEMREWMEKHEYSSVQQMKGALSQKYCADPSAFERAQYVRAIGVHTLEEPN